EAYQVPWEEGGIQVVFAVELSIEFVSSVQKFQMEYRHTDKTYKIICREHTNTVILEITSDLGYGFTCSSHNNEEQPVCLICKEVLAAESMKPSKLQHHLNTKHATLSKKPIEYFERLLQTSNTEKNTLEKCVTLNDKYLLASYEVSYSIVKTKKPFTIGEQLLLPAAIRMSEIVHVKQYTAEISKIPLSNDTLSKEFSDISNDQFQQLLMRLKDRSKFAIQLDESTGISEMVQLLLFVRYIYEGSIHEDILFCSPLEGHIRGKDIYIKINEFSEKEGLNWKNCVGVCALTVLQQ
ncbi:zinc finger BED domain-containing protein 5-like, partial [Artemia franciscana]|uniref:zinc finger BED domain-containing protein 5-like n=1 Tax=Artemia franciscana TaxID=6661 RepID=UPI0032DB6FA9